jgi:TolB-like protein/tetratricopeptide (TPR) repeat protein
MTDPDGSHQLIFGRFQLDLGKRELRRDGASVKLGRRALDILCVLAQAEGKVVSKSELMAEIWPGIVVEESNIQVHVSNLRKALDEGTDGQGFVVTVPGRGYRFLGLQSRPQAEQPGIQPTVNASETCVAVLPFTNMSGEPEQEYFADGIVEDIITGLSRIKWLFVIARNSSFIYKGKPIDVRQVARELGSRYVLEGSVRRFGDRVRLTAQLIEAQTGRNLWAERYDRLLGDIFAVQDEITMSVIGAIEPNLRKAEVDRVMRKRPDSLDAYELVLRALPSVNNFMVTGAVAAIPMLQKALELEPDYAGAHALLARCFHFQYSRGGLHEEDRLASIRHARAAMTSDDATTLAIAGLMIWFDEHDVGAAFDLFDRALAISNSNVVALGNSAFALAWMGETDRAIERARRALRVSPFDTLLAYLAIAIAQFHAKRYDEAREAARRATESNPSFSVPHVLLAVALVQLGRLAEAKIAAQRVLELDPGFTMRSWSVTVGVVPSVFEPFAEGWCKLGFVDA